MTHIEWAILSTILFVCIVSFIIMSRIGGLKIACEVIFKTMFIIFGVLSIFIIFNVIFIKLSL